MVTTDSFRETFPEFAAVQNDDPETPVYPGEVITYWTTIAGFMLNASRFGDDLIDLATCLFVAHHVVLEAADSKAVTLNQLPGVTKGIISAASQGDVSVTYDSTSAIDEGAGHWNLTKYGLRLHRMMMLCGAGPIQIGPGCSGSGGAWPGPPTWPGWLGS
jgi:hypothetical protein